ncbi:MAG: nucleotidyl transferase AbiEii/AbiGii toxin family protein [Gammaproteobacteria bacterium]|nr:nucleotidyl transferase AbiEii/AbiGii toxin family protein [Gammaproteobacteria bacterium]
MRVDIVPFGETIQEQDRVKWPPDSAISLNVAGFSEALEHALTVRIREQLTLDIPVVSPPGLTLLKLIAWQERDRTLRQRDASDLKYLLETYQDLPTVRDTAFDDPDMMEELDWDLVLAGAHILGRHSRNIALDSAADTILNDLPGCGTKRAVGDGYVSGY